MLYSFCVNKIIDFIVKCNNYSDSVIYNVYHLEKFNNINMSCIQVTNDINYFYDEFELNYILSIVNKYFIENYKNNNEYDDSSIMSITNVNYLYNLLYVIYSFLFVFLLSGIFSTIYVSHIVYKPMIENFRKDILKSPELYEYDGYLFEYLDEFNDLSDNILNRDYLKNLKFKYIKQDTPKGNVLMNYDYDNESFDYYTKSSNNIPFNYLDVVSRIYCVKYDCKKLYHDNYDNLNPEYFEKNGQEEKEEEKEEENEEGKEQQRVDVEKNKFNNIFYRNKNIKEKSTEKVFTSNKYKYKGTITDFYDMCKKNNYNINNTNINDINIPDLSGNKIDIFNDVSFCFSNIDNESYNFTLNLHDKNLKDLSENLLDNFDSYQVVNQDDSLSNSSSDSKSSEIKRNSYTSGLTFSSFKKMMSSKKNTIN